MNNENNKTNENNNSGNHNEGRRMKNMLNSKLEYYYGFGMGRYGEVLNELFVHGNVNSHRTSSIPLAEFWQPDNLGRITQVLRPYLSRFDAEKALKFFEFPTDPEVDGTRIGRPSMTDLIRRYPATKTTGCRSRPKSRDTTSRPTPPRRHARGFANSRPSRRQTWRCDGRCSNRPARRD